MATTPALSTEPAKSGRVLLRKYSDTENERFGFRSTLARRFDVGEGTLELAAADGWLDLAGRTRQV